MKKERNITKIDHESKKSTKLEESLIDHESWKSNWLIDKVIKSHDWLKENDRPINFKCMWNIIKLNLI